MTTECMASLGLAWLPFLVFYLAGMALFVAYTISYVRDYLLYTDLAFISDAGDVPPASCWFAFFFSTVSFIFVITILIRFLEIKHHLTHKRKKVRNINIASTVLGVIASFGLGIVANFSESSATALHFTGAFITFIFSSLYIILQSYLTYALIKNEVFGFKWMLGIRITIGVICLGVFFVAAGCSEFTGHQYPPYNETYRPYDNETLYYVTTSSEWICTISTFLFILSLGYEFASIRLEFKVVTLPESCVLSRQNKKAPSESENLVQESKN